MRESAEHEEAPKGYGQQPVDEGVQIVLVPVKDVEDDARNDKVRSENHHLYGSLHESAGLHPVHASRNAARRVPRNRLRLCAEMAVDRHKIAGGDRSLPMV